MRTVFPLVLLALTVASGAWGQQITNGAFAGPTPYAPGQDAFWKGQAAAIGAGGFTSQSGYLPHQMCSWSPYTAGGMAYSMTVIRGLQEGDIVEKVYDQYWRPDAATAWARFYGGHFWLLVGDYTHNGGNNTIADWLIYMVKETDGTYTLVTGQGVYFLLDTPDNLPDAVGMGMQTTETLTVYRGGTLSSPLVSSRGYTYSSTGQTGGTVVATEQYAHDMNIVGPVALAAGNILAWDKDDQKFYLTGDASDPASGVEVETGKTYYYGGNPLVVNITGVNGDKQAVVSGASATNALRVRWYMLGGSLYRAYEWSTIGASAKTAVFQRGQTYIYGEGWQSGFRGFCHTISNGPTWDVAYSAVQQP